MLFCRIKFKKHHLEKIQKNQNLLKLIDDKNDKGYMALLHGYPSLKRSNVPRRLQVERPGLLIRDKIFSKLNQPKPVPKPAPKHHADMRSTKTGS